MKKRIYALLTVVASLSMVLAGCSNPGIDNPRTYEKTTFSTEDSYYVLTENTEVSTSASTVSTSEPQMTELAETTSAETVVTTAIQTTLSASKTSATPTQTAVANTPSTEVKAETTMANPPMPAVMESVPSTTVEMDAPLIIPDAPEDPDFPETPDLPVTPEPEIQELPKKIMRHVESYQNTYPNMEIGVGIYSLDGTKGYEYNADKLFNGACTIKAAYSLFVCKVCDEENIDVNTEKLHYTSAYHHGGSGVIQKKGYDKWYTINELLVYLDNDSDNDAMELLTSRFKMKDFYTFNSALGGEDDRAAWNCGKATIRQRRAEWLAIYDYVNSDAPNAANLRRYLTNTKYAYLMYAMPYWPDYMHKSGWVDDSYTYPSAADAAIIQDKYLMIVMTQDYSEGKGHIDAIAQIGNAIDDYNCYYSLFDR